MEANSENCRNWWGLRGVGFSGLIAEEVEAAGLVYYSMGRQAAQDQPAGRVTASAQVASAQL